MAIVLFEDNAHQTLLPLTYTRPVADLRIGILTIAEKWGKYLNQSFSFHTRAYLQGKFPLQIAADNLFINGAYCPDADLIEAIDKLQFGEALKKDGILIAARLMKSDIERFGVSADFSRVVDYDKDGIVVRRPEDIFRKNDAELRKDFALLTKGRTGKIMSSTNTIIGNDFFAEDGADAECCTFSTINGPIYLGEKTEVWEGTNIRGGFALWGDSQVKMGTKIYGATTIGPYCRVGGEINNAVMWGYSNKGHEGYLGNSVVGEWCNIGADSNNSNLKNNYAEVKLWDYTTEGYRGTGLQFCGLIMADHVKCGINSMFNTGTVAGVGSNIYGAGFPPNFIPDFSWGGAQHGLQEYGFDKFMETTAKVFERRDHREFNANEQGILKEVFELTRKYRSY